MLPLSKVTLLTSDGTKAIFASASPEAFQDRGPPLNSGGWTEQTISILEHRQMYIDLKSGDVFVSFCSLSLAELRRMDFLQDPANAWECALSERNTAQAFANRQAAYANAKLLQDKDKGSDHVLKWFEAYADALHTGYFQVGCSQCAEFDHVPDGCLYCPCNTIL
jgi:hypothetical protein